ncbi:MAG: ABC transporter ATP-binding protein, partial [Oscillospiraceae bacterium]
TAEKLKAVIVGAVSKYRKKQGEISAVAYDYIDNAMMYRVFGRENENTAAYERSMHEYTKSAIVSGFWETGMQPIYNMISMIGIMLVIIYGGGNVMAKIWTIGDFSAYLSIFTSMAVKSSKAAKLFNSVQKARVSWQRINPYLDEYTKAPEIKAQPCKNTKLQFSHVNFKYPMGEYLFKNVDITLKNGDWIGVTGQVAAGKSSFGRLILREYPYEGEIILNGENIKDIKNEDMSELISYMGHKPNLISDTIEENITLGRKGDLKKAVDTACLNEDFDISSENIKTMVGFKGTMLSGGQQARVALARALYRESSVVVLDDPFSAVDEKTEEEIIKKLKQNYSDRIFIIISHRLKMFKYVDKVLLLTENAEVKYETHEKLLNTSPHYQNLVNLQKVGGEHE